MNNVEFRNPEEWSRELTKILQGILRYFEEHDVMSDPTDAPAYWLIDQLTDADEVIKEFVSRWPDHDITGAPNGGSH